MANSRRSHKRVRLSRKSPRRRRRSYGFKRRQVPRTVQRLRGPVKSPFGLILSTKFTWSWEKYYAATLPVHVFRLNSPYDPDKDATLTGQPRYFTTLLGAQDTTAPYKNYRVYKCAYKVTITNPSEQPFWIVANVCNYTSGWVSDKRPTTLREAKERSDCRVKYISGSNGGKAVHYIKGTTTMAKWFGDKSVMDSDGYQAKYNTNPANIVYLDLVSFAEVPATTPNCRVSVSLTMYAMLSDRNDVVTNVA